MNVLETILVQDVPALATGVLAAIACAIVGPFLVLRRLSLMGDAISHAVVPGIVIAFLLQSSKHVEGQLAAEGGLGAVPVLIGATVVGVITATLTQLIHRLGRVEPGAAMGVVFTVLFAVGVILLEQFHAGNLHLDAQCVLYGAMEGKVWPTAPMSFNDVFLADTWRTLPPQVLTLCIVVIVDAGFVFFLFKELRSAAFDPDHAATQGIRPQLMHYLLMALVAITTVAAFEAVGSILVVAMLIIPPLCAHLLTDRLAPLIGLSIALAILATGGGYAAAAFISVNSAGMIGVMLGVLLIAVGLAAPRHGWLSRWYSWFRLTLNILQEDMLGLLYRAGEAGSGVQLTERDLKAAVGGGLLASLAWWRLGRRRLAGMESGRLLLSSAGAAKASGVIRAHRLWESYLVKHLGLRADHVHDTAMRLEHLDPTLADRLSTRLDHPVTDPHGKEIPGEEVTELGSDEATE